MPSVDELAATAAREIDEDQARMFGRRLRAVDEELSSVVDPARRLLRVGFRVRLGGILAGPAPRALRMRALADFYYSQLGLQLHRDSLVDAPSLGELASGLSWSRVAAGVEHALLEGRSPWGPIHAGLLRIDPGQVRLEVRDLRGAMARGLPFAEVVSEAGAVAAVSGGFFLYSEPDITPPSRRFDPVGLLVSGGRVLNPPTHRRAALLIDRTGQAAIQRVGPEGLVLRIEGRRVEVESAVNRATAEWGPAAPSMAIVGTRVLEVGETLAVPLNGFVCSLPPGCRARAGSRVDYDFPASEAIAGGPMLVLDGSPAIDLRAEDFWATAPPRTFSQDETGDRNLLPRLAVGSDRSGRLVFAAVDGRNFHRSLGLTLSGMAELMVGLGCQRACNLDGGSSKRMVVDGRAVDLASTEVVSRSPSASRVRPVHTGVLIFSAETGEEEG